MRWQAVRVDGLQQRHRQPLRDLTWEDNLNRQQSGGLNNPAALGPWEAWAYSAGRAAEMTLVRSSSLEDEYGFLGPRWRDGRTFLCQRVELREIASKQAGR